MPGCRGAQPDSRGERCRTARGCRAHKALEGRTKNVLGGAEETRRRDDALGDRRRRVEKARGGVAGDVAVLKLELKHQARLGGKGRAVLRGGCGVPLVDDQGAVDVEADPAVDACKKGVVLRELWLEHARPAHRHVVRPRRDAGASRRGDGCRAPAVRHLRVHSGHCRLPEQPHVVEVFAEEPTRARAANRDIIVAALRRHVGHVVGARYRRRRDGEGIDAESVWPVHRHDKRVFLELPVVGECVLCGDGEVGLAAGCRHREPTAGGNAHARARAGHLQVEHAAVGDDARREEARRGDDMKVIGLGEHRVRARLLIPPPQGHAGGELRGGRGCRWRAAKLGRSRRAKSCRGGAHIVHLDVVELARGRGEGNGSRGSR